MMENNYMVSAGMPVVASLGGGGGLGNRVNATVMRTVLASMRAATSTSIQESVSQHGIGRILNVTV